MKEFRDYQYRIIFDTLSGLIENGKQLNEDYIKYIGWTKEFFEEATRCLDSFINLKEKSVEKIPSYAESVLKCYKGDFHEISIKELSEIKEKVSKMVVDLDNLEKNPQEFYNTLEAKTVVSCLRKLAPCME